jgi:O-antigen/teichoic acid export membrane protein
MGLISAAFLVTAVFGETFSGSIIVFQVLIGNFLLTLLNSVFTYTLIAMNREKIYTASLLAGMIVFLTSIPVLTDLYGSAGSAAALVLFELTCFLIMYIRYCKFIFNFCR